MRVEPRADTQWWLPPRRGVVDRVPGWRSTSDALCRTPRASGSCRPDSPRGTKDRFSRALVKGCGLFDPERLPSTGCSQRVALAHDGFCGNPPPVSRLCRRGPGFRRAFAAPMLSPGVARPDVGSRGSSPRVATGQTPPVDFCNLLRSASTSDGSSEPRAPRLWSPTCAALFSSHRLSTAERIAGGGACYGTANRDVTGQGPALERFAH
jgi:hypothetical protein